MRNKRTSLPPKKDFIGVPKASAKIKKEMEFLSQTQPCSLANALMKIMRKTRVKTSHKSPLCQAIIWLWITKARSRRDLKIRKLKTSKTRPTCLSKSLLFMVIQTKELAARTSRSWLSYTTKHLAVHLP